MRILYSWLRELVPVDVPPAELAERLTSAGLAVENIEVLGEGISGVVAGRIIEMEKHPNADRLFVCQVDAGQGELLTIVTGATNVKAGDTVPVALIGARLAGGRVIKKSKLRGVESWGMLCSGEELGIDPRTMPADQAHGIMLLPSSVVPGTDVCQLLGFGDVVLELELTPNRGDCLSVLGVAREVAALYRLPLRLPQPELAELVGEGDSPQADVRVDIVEPELCRRYVARLFTGVKIAPSPLWMQQRLRAVGVRPINNVVDITNYVMFELGQPLHAFDFTTLKDGRIVVRRAAEREVLVTLDGVERQLDPEVLVIADAVKPVALAGVMGGENTGITDATETVLLESAWFDPVTIRRTARRFGLHSESSHRFERGVDLTGCLRAANRAAELLLRLNAGRVARGYTDCYPRPHQRRVVVLRPERVEYILGLQVPQEEIEGILSRLEFRVQVNEGRFLVTIPPHRHDIGLEEDLVEEVARLYGYERVPMTTPGGQDTLGRRSFTQEAEYRIRTVLAACGFNESITFGFTSPVSWNRFRLPEASPLRTAVRILNPLSEEQSVMRTLIVPNLLEVLQRNYFRRQTSAAVYEIGRVFLPVAGQKLPAERLKLALAAYGELAGSWNRPALPVDFFVIKGVLELLWHQLRFPEVEWQPTAEWPGLHSGRAARLLLEGEEVGFVGELHPEVCEEYELPRTVVAEIYLDTLLAGAGREVVCRPLPRFPAVERDLAVVAPLDVPYAAIQRTIRRAGGELLQGVELFDVYQGPQVPAGYRSLAFALTFQAPDRTLTEEEVNTVMEKIIAALNRETGARLRSK